jgi:hypothetical protein
MIIHQDMIVVMLHHKLLIHLMHLYNILCLMIYIFIDLLYPIKLSLCFDYELLQSCLRIIHQLLLFGLSCIRCL